MFNITQLIIFGLIGGIALITVIILIIEEGDELDLPLIPSFATLGFFGAIGSIMTLLEIELFLIIIIDLIISIALFTGIYFGLRSMTSKPEDLKKYIGKKAEVEIPIEPNSTGRIRLISTENSEEFPAKSENYFRKNEEVIIKDFSGSIAIVKPINGRGKKMHPDDKGIIVCDNCKATIEAGTLICPYCGKNLEDI